MIYARKVYEKLDLIMAAEMKSVCPRRLSLSFYFILFSKSEADNFIVH
jgi:hypothetical protein